MKQVLALLADGFELLEAATFTDILGWNMVTGNKETRLVLAGESSQVHTSFEHKVTADILWEQVDAAAYDALVIPGGFARYGFFAAQDKPQVLSIIQDFAAEDKYIAAVCTGSLLLGAAGILGGRRATTYEGENGRWLEQLRGYGALLSDSNPCLDGNILTSSNPASAAAVALKLLELLTDSKNAAEVALMMGYIKKPTNIN